MHQIASSQFADACDIPRPTISQLLNGRNKKVSDELLSKIHIAYPNLSIMWLMFGDEPMLFNNCEDDVNIPSTGINNMHDHAFDFENQNLSSLNSANTTLFDGVNALESSGMSPMSDNINKPYKSDQKNSDKQIPSENPLIGVNNKKIVNIMVFYSDNSFESFKPSH